MLLRLLRRLKDETQGQSLVLGPAMYTLLVSRRIALGVFLLGRLSGTDRHSGFKTPGPLLLRGQGAWHVNSHRLPGHKKKHVLFIYSFIFLGGLGGL